MRSRPGKPLLDALQPWLKEKLALEVSSNAVERAIKPQVLTRTNALFAGNDGGAARQRLLRHGLSSWICSTVHSVRHGAG